MEVRGKGGRDAERQSAAACASVVMRIFTSSLTAGAPRPMPNSLRSRWVVASKPIVGRLSRGCGAALLSTTSSTTGRVMPLSVSSPATFKSTRVQAAGTNRFTVDGDLTVKGVTQPVTLDVTLNGAGEHPMRKVPAIGFDASTTLKRSDFGLGGYAPAVSDEVKVHITTEAFVPAPGTPAG